MKISHSWLQSYFKEKLPTAEKLAELFNMHSFEVEGIEKIGKDSVLDVKVLPDKSHHALSHRGVATETGAILGLTVTDEQGKPIAIEKGLTAPAASIADPKLCKRYVSRLIKNASVSDSPAWLRERLEAGGSRSISTVVDATNYVMFDVGQPLHAFDADKIQGKIVIRRAKAGEKVVLLDGREIALTPEDGVIADDAGPLDIAGVKGGKRAEVSATTKNILMTACNFDPISVRRTSTKYNLRNDASKRFENDITPHLAAEAMERVTALVLSLCPKASAGEVLDMYPHPAKPWTIQTDVRAINGITGLDLSAKEMAGVLSRLRCAVEVKGDSLSITPPLDRLDLTIPEDIADEVSRIYGYDKLVSKQTPEIAPVPLDPTFYWAEKAKNVLVGLGFSETLLYSLVAKGAFEVSYPLASDKSAMRESIAPKLKESLIANGRNADLLGLDAIKVFEIGRIFPKEGERTSLCIGVLQVKKKKGVTAESLLAAAVADLGKAIGIDLKDKAEAMSQSAVIEFDFSELVAKLGPAGKLADLHFKALPKDKTYVPFSPYPFIVRDIALFVPAGTTETAVSDAIRSAAGSLVIKGPTLFDKFEKDGRISYGFRMIFQSFDKTLSDEEANSHMEKVYSAVKKQGWEVR